jgi:hypothetical protein
VILVLWDHVQGAFVFILIAPEEIVKVVLKPLRQNALGASLVLLSVELLLEQIAMD